MSHRQKSGRGRKGRGECERKREQQTCTKLVNRLGIQGRIKSSEKRMLCRQDELSLKTLREELRKACGAVGMRS